MSILIFPKMVRYLQRLQCDDLIAPVFDVEAALTSERKLLFTLADVDEL